jgi:hypothetical protein
LSETAERIRRFGRLIRRHHWLLLTSWALLIYIRLTLSVSGYRKVLAQIERLSPRAEPGIPLLVLTWAVAKTARCVPGASCLTQALALRYLARREGQACIMRIGVKHEPGRAFEAHAWVIADGEIVLGGIKERVAEFKPIVDL